MRLHSVLSRAALAALFAALVLLSPRFLAAQTSTGSVRGYVKDSSGTALSGADLEAKNVANGVSRTTQSGSDGAYTFLGLVPGTYDITVRDIGHAPQLRRIAVAVGATMNVSFTLGAGAAVEVQAVTVTAAAVETRTSEIATNVTPQQVQALPTPSRNFLDLAALAPGVSVTPDFVNLGANGTTPRTFSAGAQGPGEVNVFIDGASLKNDLTGGGASGVAGQDASRGNPFPRNAIQEYRVLTQNFKAEYQNASSAIISATTKSGGNVWSGGAFLNYEDRDFVTLDSISLANQVTKPDYSRYLLGLNAGGPLIKDKLFFFGSYEGNVQNRANVINFTLPAPGTFDSLDAKNLGQYNGAFASPFRETLIFGKLNYNVGTHSAAELSLNDRHETDVRDFGGTTAFDVANNYRNNELTGILKYNYFTGPWLNEASATYENFERNPSPATPGLPNQLFRRTTNFSGGDIGSNQSLQDFKQKGFTLRDNLTYTGFHAAGDHVIKGGVSASFLSFDIDKANNETPQFQYGDTISKGDCNCAADTNVYAYRVPFQVQLQVGNPLVSTNNTQLGAFLQDDWSPSSRLTLNLGVRWDYETNMMDNKYKTPQDVRDTIGRYDADTNFLLTPVDTARYFTNGTQRHPFGKAFQPRLGFSYALDDENKTTLFGGWGLYYDRTYFDIAVDEQLKLTRPNYTIFFADSGVAPVNNQVAWNDNYLNRRAALDSLVTAGAASGQALHEVWLIPNDLKMPHSTQWNLGLRHLFGDVLVSAAYVGVRGYDGVVGNWYNIKWNNFGTPTSNCCDFKGNAHGISNVIVFTNNVKTWYDAVQIQITRPYRKVGDRGWGAGLSYTNGKRSVQGNDNPDDELAFPQSVFIPKHPTNDERSRIVANWIVDLPSLANIQFSGLVTLGSGPHYDIGGRFSPNSWVPGGFTPPRHGFILPADFWAYRDVDIRLSRDFAQVWRGTTSVTLDVFNVFNFQNFTYFSGNPTPTGLLSDGRRMSLGVGYNF